MSAADTDDRFPSCASPGSIPSTCSRRVAVNLMRNGGHSKTAVTSNIVPSRQPKSTVCTQKIRVVHSRAGALVLGSEEPLGRNLSGGKTVCFLGDPGRWRGGAGGTRVWETCFLILALLLCVLQVAYLLCEGDLQGQSRCSFSSFTAESSSP